MSYVQQGGMTWCDNTPENWREFHAYKTALFNRWYPQKKARSPKPFRPVRPVIFYGYNTVKG